MTQPTIREPVSSSILNNIAVPRSHSRRRRSTFDFVNPNTRNGEHHDAPQRECAYPGESDRSRAARIFCDFRFLRFDEKRKIDMLPLGFLTRAFVSGLSDLQKTFRKAGFQLPLFELRDGLSRGLGVLPITRQSLGQRSDLGPERPDLIGKNFLF